MGKIDAKLLEKAISGISGELKTKLYDRLINLAEMDDFLYKLLNGTLSRGLAFKTTLSDPKNKTAHYDFQSNVLVFNTKFLRFILGADPEIGNKGFSQVLRDMLVKALLALYGLDWQDFTLDVNMMHAAVNGLAVRLFDAINCIEKNRIINHEALARIAPTIPPSLKANSSVVVFINGGKNEKSFSLLASTLLPYAGFAYVPRANAFILSATEISESASLELRTYNQLVAALAYKTALESAIPANHPRGAQFIKAIQAEQGNYLNLSLVEFWNQLAPEEQATLNSLYHVRTGIMMMNFNEVCHQGFLACMRAGNYGCLDQELACESSARGLVSTNWFAKQIHGEFAKHLNPQDLQARDLEALCPVLDKNYATEDPKVSYTFSASMLYSFCTALTDQLLAKTNLSKWKQWVLKQAISIGLFTLMGSSITEIVFMKVLLSLIECIKPILGINNINILGMNPVDAFLSIFLLANRTNIVSVGSSYFGSAAGLFSANKVMEYFAGNPVALVSARARH